MAPSVPSDGLDGAWTSGLVLAVTILVVVIVDLIIRTRR
jgi:hypothetical protein